MDTLLILFLSIALILLGSTVGVMVYFYTHLVRRFSNVQKENVYLRFHIQEKNLVKINQARDKALKIIQDASQEASEILKKAHLVEGQTNESLKSGFEDITHKQQEALQKAAYELSSSFEETMKQLKDDDINIFKNTSESIKQVTLQEVEAFKTQLANQTIGAEKVVDEKVHEAFEKTKGEIEAYKAEQIKEIDAKLQDVLHAVTKEVIGKKLSYSDHEELIKNALEKAKHEILING